MSIGEKQRLARLRFYLYDRPLHPELFNIHHDHRIAKNGYEARIWMTGCSHVIAFYRDEFSMVEVTADETSELPERGLLVNMPLRGEKDHQCRRSNGINYMVNFQVETMSPAVYARTHHDLSVQGAKGGIFVPFFQWSANSLTPFSYVDYNAGPRELHVFAFHALPEDLTVVKTQSIFELA
jgi:hypothetical protein